MTTFSEADHFAAVECISPQCMPYKLFYENDEFDVGMQAQKIRFCMEVVVGGLWTQKSKLRDGGV